MQFNGTLGDDLLSATDSNDIIDAMAGNDVASGGLGDDSISGGSGTDFLGGARGNDSLSGGDDDDTLQGGVGWASDDLGADTIVGGAGNDTQTGGFGNDSQDGGDGADRIEDYGGSNTISGGSGNDAIELRFGGFHIVDAGADQDTVFGRGGGYIIDAGSGRDRVDISGSGGTVFGGDGEDTVTAVSGVEVGEFLLIGGAGNDSLRSSTGADTLEGGHGNDTLAGDTGADMIVLEWTEISGSSDQRIYQNLSGVDVIALDPAEGDKIVVRGVADIADFTRHVQAVMTSTSAGPLYDFRFDGVTFLRVSAPAYSQPYDPSWFVAAAADNNPPPRGDADGEVIRADHAGDTLAGGAGTDTLYASQGPDQLTGGGGADQFAFEALPWRAGVVTDFANGSDKIDLRALLQASGYMGADAVADRYVSFESDGAGGTKVMYDTDGTGSGQAWSYHITTLQGVAASSLSNADLVGGSTGGNQTQPGGDPAAGQVLTADQPGDTLAGGAGNDTLNASQGPDQLTGAGGADRFVFGKAPWNAGVITDFAVGSDKIDVSALLDAYAGSNPMADGWLRLDEAGGSTKVYVDIDGAGGEWPFLITTLQGVPPSNVGLSDFVV